MDAQPQLAAFAALFDDSLGDEERDRRLALGPADDMLAKAARLRLLDRSGWQEGHIGQVGLALRSPLICRLMCQIGEAPADAPDAYCDLTELWELAGRPGDHTPEGNLDPERRIGDHSVEVRGGRVYSDPFVAAFYAATLDADDDLVCYVDGLSWI